MNLFLLFSLTITYSNFSFGMDSLLKNKTAEKRTYKIIGGWVVGIEKVPYHVAIVKNRSRAPSCGGSIITRWHVVTAAHCIK